MVNRAHIHLAGALALGTAVLLAAAWLRGAEYDEQYTLFLTAGTPRPAWPEAAFPASLVGQVQATQGNLVGIVQDLRSTDVHPPLYFLAASLWRRLVGPGLFAARVFSVLCGVGCLALVAVLARLAGRPAAIAVVMTAGCYGFAYTGAIARGFALAELLLLGGVALLLVRRPMLAGMALGMACGCNYLAVFPAAASCLAAAPRRRMAWFARVLPPALPFLTLDAWYFAAQHAARDGQFPPFAPGPALVRLAAFQAASVFGGLPLYWDGAGRVAAYCAVVLASLALLRGCLMPASPSTRSQRSAKRAALVIRRVNRILKQTAPRRASLMRDTGVATQTARIVWVATPDSGLWADSPELAGCKRQDRTTRRGIPAALAMAAHRRRRPGAATHARVFRAAVLAMPAGLLLLGIVFDNTPIELRYLSFGLPFLALLAARPGSGGIPRFRRNLGMPRAGVAGDGAQTQGDTRIPKKAGYMLILSVQAAGIAGLLLSPQTMQPARAAARDAAPFIHNALVLLPAGNDGVGIVGAFGLEAPPDARMKLVRPSDPPVAVPSEYRRVILALLDQDRDSRAAVPVLRASVAGPNWRRIAIGRKLEVYERTDGG